MKQIYNWQKASVADIEADGLLDEATKIHVLACTLSNGKDITIKGSQRKALKSFVQYHIDNETPVVGHNFITYDIPLLEKVVGIDCSELMVIDSLYLSWYLNFERSSHGLDSFFDDYGIEKPKIDDWENLSYEEYANRCSEDVKINLALWDDLKERLIDMYTIVKRNIDSGKVDTKRVDDSEELHIDSLKGLSVEQHIDRFLTFLMSKADKARLRQDTRILIDQELLDSTEKELEAKVLEAKTELESVMPDVPKYTKKNYPKNPTKKDGTLSVHGESWNKAVEGLDLKDDLGTPLSLPVEGYENVIQVLKGYEPPNINSSKQIKDWLFSFGWKPQTFDFKKDKEAQEAWAESGFKKELKPKVRKIPQLSIDGEDGKELCPSVLKLAEKIPEIRAYSGYTLLVHRKGFCDSFRNALDKHGKVIAEVGGLTNTLREKHRKPICNIPSVSRPYGENLRGMLTCGKGQTMLGSDLSSLEDRVKNHFCLPHDPEYVDSVDEEGYDPHLKMCLTSGMVTEQEYLDWTLKGIKSPNAKAMRPKGKTASYALVYGSGAETLSKSGDMTLEEAKALHKAYWEIHWYVKAISEEQCIVQCSRGHNWLINPVNGFCYSVRTEKDIFSTLVQGTGSYLFDVWVDYIMEEMYNRWGKCVLSLCAHDELAFPLRDTPKLRNSISLIVKDAIEKVNRQFNLRIPMDCDVQFGKTYADIH